MGNNLNFINNDLVNPPTFKLSTETTEKYTNYEQRLLHEELEILEGKRLDKVENEKLKGDIIDDRFVENGHITEGESREKRLQLMSWCRIDLSKIYKYKGKHRISLGILRQSLNILKQCSNGTGRGLENLKLD